MSKYQTWIVLILLITVPSCNIYFEQSPFANLVSISTTDTKEAILLKAAHVVPTSRQLSWQQRELTAFLHFGINTFTDKEWGDGTEDPALFNPTKLDAGQWVSVLKEAGFRQVIITAKHHDGFCLWPSAFTSHSVKSSPWKNGHGDVIKELADACVKQNMPLGVYLSPWDRHEPRYGSDAYNEYFRSQLRELLTNYGPISEVWFDGAVGEGPNGKKQIYDWGSFYSIVRDLQPQAVIAVMGPDIRWVGTETGYGRDTEWSVIPIADSIQLTPTDAQDNIIKPAIKETAEEIASINQLAQAYALKWYPSEVDVSIRPGWFYHAAEDGQVKSPEKLLDIYFNSIGKNSALLLNIPPDKNGLIPEKDATILKVFNYSLKQIFSQNLGSQAEVSDNEFNFNHPPSRVLDGKMNTYWAPDASNNTPYLHFEWPKPIWFNILSLSEQIEFGQRVSGFQLEVYENDSWVTKVSGTTIGYKRLIRFPYIMTNKVRMIFSEFRLTPNIAEIGFYQDIPQVTISPEGKPFVDSLTIYLSTNNPDATIHYSQNYTLPSASTNLYTSPLRLTSGSPLLAAAISPDGRVGFVKDELYSKAKYEVDLLTTPSPEFLNEGGIQLCDGVKGDKNLKSGKWLGYQGQHLEVIFDQGKDLEIRSINIYTIHQASASIYQPKSILIYGSDQPDGSFKLFKQYFPESIQNTNSQLLSLSIPKINKSARYIKILIENEGGFQPENAAAPWLFISEIEIIN